MLTGIVKAPSTRPTPTASSRRRSSSAFTGARGLQPRAVRHAVAALISPDKRHLRYVNAGHPPIVVWGARREPQWLESTGPLVSPVLIGATWDAPMVPIDEGDHLLLYTDGVSEILADEDGRAEERFSRRSSARRKAAGRCSTRFSPTCMVRLAAGFSRTISRC